MENVEFVTEPSLSLQCPICHEVCIDPVITHVCHHSYCTGCIIQSLEMEPYCPLCRRKLRSEDLHPNLALASLIAELPVHCTNRLYGCSAILHLDQLPYHVKAKCSYAPTRCINTRFGCTFQGITGALPDHLDHCPYELIKPYLITTDERIAKLTQKLDDQEKEIGRLRLYISRSVKHSTTFSPSDIPDSTIPCSLLNTDDYLRGQIAATTITTSTMDQIINPDHDLNGLDTNFLFPYNDIQCHRTIREYSCGVSSVAYNDGIIFSGGHDGSIKTFDVDSGNLIDSHQEHRESVWSLAVHTTTSRLFSASKDQTIGVWDVSSTSPSRHSHSSVIDTSDSSSTLGRTTLKTRLIDHTGKIYSVCVSGDRMYSGSSDRTIKVWDTTNLKCLATWQGHTEGVNAIIALEDGQIVSASNDCTVRIWDPTTGICLRSATLSSEVLDVTCSTSIFHHSPLLFASTYDATISALPVDTLVPTATLVGHNWEVWQLKYHHGVLFSGSFDHTIKRWDTRNMFTCTKTLLGHKGFVHAMCVGQRSLISGCADRTIKIWS